MYDCNKSLYYSHTYLFTPEKRAISLGQNLPLGVTQGKDKDWLLKDRRPCNTGSFELVFWFKGPRKDGCLKQVIP